MRLDVTDEDSVENAAGVIYDSLSESGGQVITVVFLPWNSARTKYCLPEDAYKEHALCLCSLSEL